MTLDQIREVLQDRKLTVVAKAVGLHVLTVRKIANGSAKAVTSTTLEKLTDYLTAGDRPA